MSNFAFLQPNGPCSSKLRNKAEGCATAMRAPACFYARRTLELAVAWLYKHDRHSSCPIRTTSAR